MRAINFFREQKFQSDHWVSCFNSSRAGKLKWDQLVKQGVEMNQCTSRNNIDNDCEEVLNTAILLSNSQLVNFNGSVRRRQ